MPTYEYRCPEGHEFEVFQRMSEEPGAECPRCGKAAERLLSAGAGFLFKGDGFYITDYRSKDYRERAKAEQNPNGGSAGKKEGSGSGGGDAGGGSAGGASGAGKGGSAEGGSGDSAGGSSSAGSSSGPSTGSSSGSSAGSSSTGPAAGD